MLPPSLQSKIHRKAKNHRWRKEESLSFITGWWLTYPSEKIWIRQLVWYSQRKGKNKNHVPNHQPDKYLYQEFWDLFLYLRLQISHWYSNITLDNIHWIPIAPQLPPNHWIVRHDFSILKFWMSMNWGILQLATTPRRTESRLPFGLQRGFHVNTEMKMMKVVGLYSYNKAIIFII